MSVLKRYPLSLKQTFSGAEGKKPILVVQENVFSPSYRTYGPPHLHLSRLEFIAWQSTSLSTWTIL